LAAMYAVLGNTYKAACLNAINFPVLLLEAKFTKLGFRAILVSEVALIAYLTSKSKMWKIIFNILYKREPQNLWYGVLAGKNTVADAEKYRDSFPRDRICGSWHWNGGEPNRGATGIDLQLLPLIAKKM